MLFGQGILNRRQLFMKARFGNHDFTLVKRFVVAVCALRHHVYKLFDITVFFAIFNNTYAHGFRFMISSEVSACSCSFLERLSWYDT